MSWISSVISQVSHDTFLYLEQKCYRSIIGMGSGSHRILVLFEHIGLHFWVVQEPQSVVTAVTVGIKPGFLNSQSDGNGAHHIEVKLFAKIEEA